MKYLDTEKEQTGTSMLWLSQAWEQKSAPSTYFIVSNLWSLIKTDKAMAVRDACLGSKIPKTLCYQKSHSGGLLGGGKKQ